MQKTKQKKMNKRLKYERATGQWLQAHERNRVSRDFVGPTKTETAHQTSHLAAKNWAPFLNKETLRLQGLHACI